MTARGRARSTAEHHLVAHEFPVVFAEGAGAGAITGVGEISAPGPLPDVAEHLTQLVVRLNVYRRRLIAFCFYEITLDREIGRGPFPFELGRQSRSAPIREGVRFKMADVRYGLRLIDWEHSGKRKVPPAAVTFRPIKRRFPALLVYGRPA